MIQVSLDSEPPPAFRGKKEVKKKSKNLPQLVFSFKNEHNGNNVGQQNNKKLEDKIKNNPTNIISAEKYSTLEKSSSEENTSSSQKNIKFSKASFNEEDLDSSTLNYLRINEESFRENQENLYFQFESSEYKFRLSQTFIKGDDKEKKDYLESREKQEKEPFFILFSFEENKVEEERVIKWNATAYN